MIPPPLTEHQIHVVQTCLDLPVSLIDRLVTLLSQDELLRAGQMRRPLIKNSFIAGRGVLRLLIGRYLGCGPSAFAFTVGPHGKPLLAPETNLQFNLSHTGGLALAAFGRGSELGVDVERIRPIKELDRLAREYFTDNERMYLDTAGPDGRTECFFRLWTRKEACLKAMGAGIAGSPSRVETAASAGLAEFLASGGRSEPEMRWRVVDFEAAGHPAALAVSDLSPEWDMTLHSLTEQEIEELAAGRFAT